MSKSTKALFAAGCLITGIGLSLCFDSPWPGLVLLPLGLLFALSGLGFFAFLRESWAEFLTLREELKQFRK